MIKKLFKSLAFMTFLAVSAGATAAPIGLSLVIDGSGSISGANFTTQKAGYIAALNNVIPGFYGNIAISVVQFSSSATVEQAMIAINNAADLTTLTNSIMAMTQQFGGTNIGLGISTASTDMAAFGFAGLERAVIDVSTDGVGSGAVAGAMNFVNNDAINTISGTGAVNCLGIGGGANCNFEFGLNAFEILVPDFASIQLALETKLKRELGGVPEPGMIALLGLGLLGLGVTRRRKLVA